jgi:FtsZ-interacting cell division protein ZipA
MARMATQLASTLGGRVVDDRGNALDERALAAIGAELEPIRRQLSENGVEPGSLLALRLFS